MKAITISTDKEKLDIEFIHVFISNSYWGKGRTIEQTVKGINNSMNFGIYVNNKQIGYARVVTDYTFFAYLFDVFLVKSERGKGYATKLMDNIFKNTALKDVRNWKLSTVDAHNFYRKNGFDSLKDPDKIMEKIIS